MKKILLLTLLLLFAMTLQAQWMQIGEDIDGETEGENSGRVSLSSDGSIVAIGAQQNDDNGSAAGQVRVYQNLDETWVQLGNDLNGEDEINFFGQSVSLSDDGSILAVGAHYNDGNGEESGHVRVFKYEADEWVQMGIDIDGEAAFDHFGWVVSLSADGSILAIGAILNDGNGVDAGHVRVFQFEGGDWVQIGDDIDGENARDEFGRDISLSADGTILAISATTNDDNGENAGHTRIFKFEEGTWNQLGANIDGDAGDFSGGSIGLNFDGTIIAIGASQNSHEAGVVRVFQYSDEEWVQFGEDIIGENIEDYSGSHLSISEDGFIVAIGALGNDDNGDRAGHVRVFQYDIDTWIQIGSDIDGEAAIDISSTSLDLSADGSIVAIGATLNDGINGDNSGHVRVYKNSVLGILENNIDELFILYPNPTNGIVNLLLNNLKESISISIIDITGKKLYQLNNINQNNLQLPTSSLSNGVYLVIIQTKTQQKTLKLIKQ